MRKTWLIAGGGAVAVGIGVAAALTVGGDGGATAGPTSSGPSQSASPTASVSPGTPEPSPPVVGAIPVPALPASSIPWDEVGPGWFLLTYDPDTLRDAASEAGSEQDSVRHHPPMHEAVMFVSPFGDLYYVRSLEGTGRGTVEAWSGRSIFVLDGQWAEGTGETPHGQLTSLDLASGARAALGADVVQVLGVLRTLEDGRVVTWGSGEGTTWVDVAAADFSDSRLVCSTEGPASVVSPDGTSVVCLESAYPKSAVMVYNVVDGTSSQIDTFKLDPSSYSIHGWWDNGSFVLSRPGDSGERLWWTYDVAARQLRELNAQLADGTPAVFAQGVAGYRLVATDSRVEVQDFAGALRATLPCRPRALSEGFALAVCGDREATTEISIVNLDTGEVLGVASFESGSNDAVNVFPWPGGQFESSWTLQYGWGFIDTW